MISPGTETLLRRAQARLLAAWGGACTWQFVYLYIPRLFGLVYLIACGSLSVQVEGLIGPAGLLPADGFLERVGTHAAAHGLSRVGLAPTLCWWTGTSAAALHGVCATGVVLSVLLIAGVLPHLMLALLWVLYLSLTVVGQTFLGFQWENLLLEAGLIAIALPPLVRRLPWRVGDAPPATDRSRWTLLPATLARWLLWWLLFRLMLQSGLVKLASRDDVWWNLSALEYHYWTQPLPAWTSYYVAQWPVWWHRTSTVIMFVIELLLPLCMLGPRRFRLLACWGFLLLMALIGLTGNYTYFNLLTGVLALTLVDDRHARWWLRGRFVTPGPQAETSAMAPRMPRGRLVLAGVLTAALVVYAGDALPISSVQLRMTMQRTAAAANARLDWHLPATPPEVSPALERRLVRWGAWRAINSYGLFASMTRTRPELIIEGSRDGVDWRAYGFRYKPGALDRRPGFVQPHQPRLDWQLWFAALGEAQGHPWLWTLMEGLLRGEEAILGLMGDNPFPDAPPRYVRVMRWDYRFTTRDQKAETGHWWTRGNPRPYMPVLSLRAAD